MSIFDFTVTTANSDCLGHFTMNTVDEKDYLNKGEKILTLLRQRKHKEYKPVSLFDSVSGKVYYARTLSGKFDYLISCSEKLLQEKWNKACEEEEYSQFLTDLGIDALLEVVPDNHDAAMIIQELCRRSKKPYTSVVEITIGKRTVYALTGNTTLKKSQYKKKWRLGFGSTYYYLCDVAKTYAENYLFNCLRERVQEELKILSVEQLEDNRVERCIRGEIDFLFEKHRNGNGQVVFRKNALDIPCVKEFVQQWDIAVTVGDLEGITRYDLQPFWILSNDSYFNSLNNYYNTFFIKLYELLYDVYIGEKQTEEFMKEVATEYAKVYQTKKAIPDKVIKAMSNSGFNDYFGYIEFDEECDLKALAEIEKEFRALQKAIFHQDKKKEEVSLRFRKLGRHHASGLYFPMLKCLCVDVRCPSSMAHEYGHMLDYESGNVSKGFKFSSVRETYSYLLKDFISKLDKDDPLRKRWEGNTKYNKSYYLEPTEVFARTLEIYLVQCKGIDNSLVKPDGGFAYPDDEELKNAIHRYFDEFFGLGSVGTAKLLSAAGAS